jgi:allophanate hydrolase
VIPFEPFLATARLLYEGPWLTERYAAIEDFVQKKPNALHPVTLAIIQRGRKFSGIEAFRGIYRLRELRRLADEAMAGLDFVVTPTTPRIYRISDVQRDPIGTNSNLGHYTNFVNLLDLSAVAVPAGFRRNGLPFGVTLVGPAFHDHALSEYARRLHQAQDATVGATGLPASRSDSEIPSLLLDQPAARLIVCGAHMSGLALNHQLTDRGGRRIRRARTAAAYRLYALPGGPPHRPGLIRCPEGGAAIEVEVWELPQAVFGDFLTQIPAPLGLGRVELEDGAEEIGFLCEGYAVDGARDITELGGWRRFLELDA